MVAWSLQHVAAKGDDACRRNKPSCKKRLGRFAEATVYSKARNSSALSRKVSELPIKTSSSFRCPMGVITHGSVWQSERKLPRERSIAIG